MTFTDNEGVALNHNAKPFRNYLSFAKLIYCLLFETIPYNFQVHYATMIRFNTTEIAGLTSS